LRIKELDSALFIMKTPSWAKGKKEKTGKKSDAAGDPRFWNARGVVSDFLGRLYELALAPMRLPQSRSEENLYLYLQNTATLRKLAGSYPNQQEFFKALESTYISDLISEVRIRVHMSDAEGSLTFRELSEGEELPVKTTDSLETLKAVAFDVVLTNPPFGKKSSVTIVAEDEEDEEENGNGKRKGKNSKQPLTLLREDFWATTSNKQLNFVQLVKNILTTNGRAAVIVPDNVLFEGGAGETVRRKLLEECDVHTLLRLPTGLFYAQGVKANVLCFDRKRPAEQPWTKELWIYDFRTNVRYTLKTNQLKRSDIDEFVACYNPENRHRRKSTWSEDSPKGRWRAYSYEELLQRDKVSLDIFWLKDENLEGESDAADLNDIMAEIVYDLRAALAQFEEIQSDMVDGAHTAL
jgi:hypothetical protein